MKNCSVKLSLFSSGLPFFHSQDSS